MKKIIAIIFAVVACFMVATVPVSNTYAITENDCANLGPDWKEKNEDCKKNCSETTNLGTEVVGGNGLRITCDDGTGSGIRNILKLVIDIISIIVGVLGVTGIVVVGIMYLTAAGDVSKAVKAKTRLVEIIVGLILYALTYAILNFLIPNFSGTSFRENPSISEIAKK